jgi:plastocyanin
MRRIQLGALALVALILVGTAAANTVTVTVTKNGYVPRDVTLAVGDAVQFTNSDSAAHELRFKTTTGVACTPNPLVLQPTQSGSCTFVSPGTFSYDDPNAKGNTFRGTITVPGPTTPAATLSIASAPQMLLYAGKSTLSGTLSSLTVGENVDVMATACGQTASNKAATVQTTAGGLYAAVVQPLQTTAYTTKTKSATSATIVVKVKPRVQLSRVGAHRYLLRVSAGQSFAGHYGILQRYNGVFSRWVNVKRVLLRRNSTGVFPTVVSSAAFGSTVPSKRRIRVVLPQLQVGGCYLPGLSNTILS